MSGRLSLGPRIQSGRGGFDAIVQYRLVFYHPDLGWRPNVKHRCERDHIFNGLARMGGRYDAGLAVAQRADNQLIHGALPALIMSNDAEEKHVIGDKRVQEVVSDGTWFLLETKTTFFAADMLTARRPNVLGLSCVAPTERSEGGPRQPAAPCWTMPQEASHSDASRNQRCRAPQKVREWAV